MSSLLYYAALAAFSFVGAFILDWISGWSGIHPFYALWLVIFVAGIVATERD